MVRGAKGELKREIHPDIRLEVKEKEIVVLPKRQSRKSAALWGLFRTLIVNMIEGVTSGFEKKLEFEGIGFRVAAEGNTLVMQLGFSHPLRFEAPPGINFKVEKNVITVSGINKELVGEVAAALRSLKPAEPYKGKGIRYQGEVVRRKAGKKAVGST